MDFYNYFNLFIYKGNTMSKEMRKIDTFKERLLKENKSTIIFEKIDEHTYKLFIDSNEIGSVYLDNAKDSVMFDKTLLPEFSNKKVWGIHQMGIKQNYQGKGYGDILISNIIKISKNNDVDLLVLGVLSENEKAVNLYKKHGFIEYIGGVVKYMYLDLKSV